MNLSSIADVVGKRMTMVGDKDVAAAKAFLSQRHDQLWRQFLWKDSLLEYDLPIDPTVAYVPTANYMPTKGHLILPPIIQHVIAARTNKNKLNVERPMVYYRVSFDQFVTKGTPCEFMSLSSCVWEFDSAQNVTLVIANPSDAAQVVNMDVSGTDGVTISRSAVTLINPTSASVNTDRIESLTNPALSGSMTLNVGGSAILTQNAGQTVVPKSQRIQFIPMLNLAMTLRVLGKRVTPSFSADTDSPGVNGMDGILIALACYDMAQRDDFSKVGVAEAELMLKESVGPQFLQNGIAGGFLKKLIEEEVEQAAWNSRIMPEDGFGGEDYYTGMWNTKIAPY